MKKLILLAMVVGLVMSGCATTMLGVQNKWGPPARTEQLENGNVVHYYYFHKGKGSALALGGSNIAILSTETMAGWMVVAITYDHEGKIVNKAQYWAQPNLNK